MFSYRGYHIDPTQKGRTSKLSRTQLDEAIKSICRKRDSQDEVIISVNAITAELEIEYDISVNPKTVRRKGVGKEGYYVKKYPDICSYNYMGDTRMRGLVVKREKFIEEVET
jgi:transposase